MYGTHSGRTATAPRLLTLCKLAAGLLVVVAPLGCATGPSSRDSIDVDAEESADAAAEDAPMILEDAAPSVLPTERPLGTLEVVARFDSQMPTGVAVSPEGRVFVNFPRWQSGIPFTLAQVIDGEAVPYPSPELNDLAPMRPAEHLMSVQSVVLDPRGDRIWALDTGRPQWKPAPEGGPKLVSIDLATDRITRTILFPSDVARKTTYLNDVRFDLRRGKQGMAFITDSSGDGPNAIIVVDLESGESWRHLDGHASVSAEPGFLPIVEGRPMRRDPGHRAGDEAGGEAAGEAEGEAIGEAAGGSITIGADGIALSADGTRLYFRVLAGRHLFSVPLDLLAERTTRADTLAAALVDHGDLGFASDGLHGDDAGNLYLTNYEDNAVAVWRADTGLSTLIHDPRLLWPDTLALSGGYLYVTANQLHRQSDFNGGRDLRTPPYVLFRTRVGTGPVRLLPKGTPLAVDGDDL